MKRSRSLALGGLALAGLVLATVAPRVAQADQQEMESRWVGKAPPRLQLHLMDGKLFDTSSPTLRGKVIVADIWATWCPPCRESLPHLQELSQDQDRAAQGLVIVAVDDGEKRPDVEPFLRDNHLTFNTVIDTQKTWIRALGVDAIPTTLVIGRDGKVANVFVGFGPDSPSELQKAVDAALAKPAPAPTSRPSGNRPPTSRPAR